MPDAVVIGSGPNGLVAANHLADAGWDVLVLPKMRASTSCTSTSTSSDLATISASMRTGSQTLRENDARHLYDRRLKYGAPQGPATQDAWIVAGVVVSSGITQHLGMRAIRAIGAGAMIVVAIAAPSRAEASPPNVAALQAALQAMRLYGGHVDGIKGPLTRRGVIAFQRRRGLPVDGIAGPRTRRALGWRGRPGLGSRVLRAGNRGWDVAALQFLLQRAGRGAGRADGLFGPLTRGAVLRAQRAASIGVDGLAGPMTIASLRRGGEPPGDPVRFLRPVPGPSGDGFGAPRGGGRRHQGLDFPVPYGTRVGAAGRGTTIYAAYNYGGYGNLVVVQHRLGFTTWYAHLSAVTSWVGEQVVGGTRIGYVGSTGYSTGPHLHFEVRRYNTPIDPVPRLLPTALTARSPGSGARRRSRECEVRRETGKPPRGSDWIARERLC